METEQQIISQTPPVPSRDIASSLLHARKENVDTIIVLDDDPTGTQTVHDIPVLTQWTIDAIRQEFATGTPLFYILTNSRSLTETEAVEMTLDIGHNIKTAAELANIRFWVISRSDSTLRGHYPAEVLALEQALDYRRAVQFIIPCFFEGGRLTINDIHYVRQGEYLIPATETPYAADPVFGYANADLKYWIEEKTGGKVKHHQVVSISLEDLRTDSLDDLKHKLASLAPGTHCVVNATCYADLEFFCLALLSVPINPLMRTAASLVAALGCLGEKELLSKEEMGSGDGGLIVVGSFVSTTTAQLDHLMKNRPDLLTIELSVEAALGPELESLIKRLVSKIENAINAGQVVVLYTSRELITGQSEARNQEIGQTVSSALTSIVEALQVQPGFLITKGGITSSDIATKAMEVKKALVKGQIIKGVPVWQLGEESRFPGLHQIIFPGNVGDEGSLTEVVNLLS